MLSHPPAERPSHVASTLLLTYMAYCRHAQKADCILGFDRIGALHTVTAMRGQRRWVFDKQLQEAVGVQCRHTFVVRVNPSPPAFTESAEMQRLQQSTSSQLAIAPLAQPLLSLKLAIGTRA